MAAGDSDTLTANLALAMLSEDPIASVNPPDPNKRGRLCYQFIDSSRRAMLAAGQWRCAKRQFQASAAAATLPFGGTAYPVPPDYIRMYELHDHQERWEVMNLAGIGVCVVTRAGAPLNEDYIFDLQDYTQMDTLLVKAIAADLATWMALPLSRDSALRSSCESERDNYLSLARTVSAQQATPRQLDLGILLRSRW